MTRSVTTTTTRKRCAGCDRPIRVKRWLSGSDAADWQHIGGLPAGARPCATVKLPVGPTWTAPASVTR